jgi:hypothetical protein
MSMRIQVDGVGEVEVDPTFGQLSPEEQNDVITEIQQSVAGGRVTSDMAAPSSLPINAGQQAFDLGAAATPTATAPPVQQTEPPETFGFDFEKAEPVLRRFFNDFNRKEDLVRNAKYGNKNDIQSDYDAAFGREIAPGLQQLGLDPDQALEAARMKRADPKLPIRDVLRSVGVQIAENTEAGGAALTPQQVEEARGLQTYIQNNINLANETEDPRQKRDYQRLASEATQKLRVMSGTPEPSPYEKHETIRGVLEELGRKKERGSLGTVTYDGVTYPVEGAAALESDLASEQADLLDRLATDPEARASIRVRPQNAIVYETNSKGEPRMGANGAPVIDQKATAAKWDELQNTAREGEIIEQEDGTIGPFMGAKKTKEGGSWIPKGLKPAVKGAGIVGKNIADSVAPLATEDNIARAAEMVMPGVGYANVKTTAAMMRNPRDTVAKLGRSVATGGTPTGFLAMLGLDYLSSVGRKAQEEEEKKRAGQ